MLARRVVLGVAHLLVFQERHGLGPGQGGALARRVAGRLAPGGQQVQALLVLAGGARVLAVHVQAEGAAVDLRDARLHQLQQRVIQPAAARVLLQPQHGGKALGRCLLVVQSLGH